MDLGHNGVSGSLDIDDEAAFDDQPWPKPIERTVLVAVEPVGELVG